MSVEYSIVEDVVKETVTIPSSEVVKDLGEKDNVLATLTAEKAKHQGIIDSYTAMIATVQTKIDAINAL